MRRTLILALLSGALVTPSLSFAQSSGPGNTPAITTLQARERVALLLAAHHDLPDHATFLAASPDAHDVLVSLAADPNLFPPHRVRAIDALARYWGSPEAFSLLSRWLSSPDTSDTTRHDLIMLAARQFDALSVPLVSPYLQHPDLQLRLTAIHALDLVDNQDAFDHLDAALAREKVDVARSALERATRQVR